MCAIFAFIIGVVLFFNPAVWGRIAQYFVSRPVSLVLLAASIVVSVLFVFGPKNKKKTNKE